VDWLAVGRLLRELFHVHAFRVSTPYVLDVACLPAVTEGNTNRLTSLPTAPDAYVV
jgi:hypothetical protein